MGQDRTPCGSQGIAINKRMDINREPPGQIPSRIAKAPCTPVPNGSNDFLSRAPVVVSLGRAGCVVRRVRCLRARPRAREGRRRKTKEEETINEVQQDGPRIDGMNDAREEHHSYHRSSVRRDNKEEELKRYNRIVSDDALVFCRKISKSK